MPTSRAEIRNKVKDVIVASGYGNPVNNHSDGDRDFVEARFSIGNEVATGMLSITDAVLEVGIFSAGADDDALDIIAQPIEDALKADDALGSLVKGFLYTGFEYPDDIDERFGAIVLKFSIKY